MTERVLTEEQNYNDVVERKNKEMEQHLYMACHDLQAPLRTITGFAGLLRQACDTSLGEQEQLYVNVIYNTAKRMSGLIKDILNYSELDKYLSLSKFDCNILMQDVTSDLQLLIDETATRITYVGLPTVTGDRTKLLQLFQNLITNAIKYRKKEVSPEITIYAAEENDKWVFCVKDNGIGIEPQYSEEIFRMFRRLHAPSQYSGYGIGLANCKKIIQLHGGDIWVESTPHIGSVFYFSVPIKATKNIPLNDIIINK